MSLLFYSLHRKVIPEISDPSTTNQYHLCLQPDSAGRDQVPDVRAGVARRQRHPLRPLHAHRLCKLFKIIILLFLYIVLF